MQTRFLKQTSISILLLLIFISLYSQTTAERPSNWGQANVGTETNPYLISNLANLKWLSERSSDWWRGINTQVHFLQTADIDATETMYWNDGRGFRPIGYTTALSWSTHPHQTFVGVYDGADFRIYNLFTAFDFLPWTSEIGLFSLISNATVKNVHIENIKLDLHRGDRIGSIVATSHYSIVQNCSASGNIHFRNDRAAVGGIVGHSAQSFIEYCHSYVSINGAGYNSNSGGIVGNFQYDSEIRYCFWSGSMDLAGTNSSAGGIVGYMINGGIIEKNCAFVDIHASGSIGGIVGEIRDGGQTPYFIQIENSFAIGIMNVGGSGGGLIGNTNLVEDYSIDKCYSATKIISLSGQTNVGGVIGRIFSGNPTISNLFWDSEFANINQAIGTGSSTNMTNTLGRTTAQMTQVSTFTDSGWDFTDIWDINTNTNYGYPYLQNLQPPRFIYSVLYITPPNNATDREFDQVLSWTSGFGFTPTGYKIYVGTSATPMPITYVDVGMNTSWTDTYEWGTQYFWQVVPYNAEGDGTSSSMHSFTIMPDPTITQFPYLQDFPTRDYPMGWRTYTSSGCSVSIQHAMDNQQAQSVPYYVELSSYDTRHAAVITPKIDNISTKRVRFYAREDYNTNRTFLVGKMSDIYDINSFDLIESVTLNTYHTEYIVPLDIGVGDYLVFKNGTASGTFLDDILIEEIPSDADMIVNFPILDFGVVNIEGSSALIVTNIGNSDLLINHLLPEEITLQIDEPIIVPPGENREIIYHISSNELGVFTPSITLMTNIETSPIHTIPVYAHLVPFELGVVVHIGDDDDRVSAAPWYPMFDVSYSQVIYTPDEINRPDGEYITSIAYQMDFDSHSQYTDTVRLYMGYTNRTVFTTDNFIDISELEQVFYGEVSIVKRPPPYQHWLEIVLDTPFLYNSNQNLVIAAICISPDTFTIQSNFLGFRAEINRTIVGFNSYYPHFTLGLTDRITPHTRLRFSTIVSENDDTILPRKTALRGNYPNPFNPETTILFDLANDSIVSIEIFNIKGQKIKTLTNEEFAAGTHRVTWDGTDTFQRGVASGVYLYRMTSNDCNATAKMLLMK